MDMLKNKQGSLIDTLIYLKAMLCSNMGYRSLDLHALFTIFE